MRPRCKMCSSYVNQGHPFCRSDWCFSEERALISRIGHNCFTLASHTGFRIYCRGSGKLFNMICLEIFSLLSFSKVFSPVASSVDQTCLFKNSVAALSADHQKLILGRQMSFYERSGVFAFSKYCLYDESRYAAALSVASKVIVQ